MREPDDPREPVAETSARLPRGESARQELGDRELATACRRGDLAAYERLYQLHGPRLKSIAFNLLGSASDAEDAVQEAFLRVYRGIGTFKGQSAFLTWVYRILLNCCYDFRRKKMRQREESLEEHAPGDETGGTDAGATRAPQLALRLALESCLAQLSPKHREAFVLFEVEGFRHSEIAEMLDISEALSKNRVYEAKRHLRNQLGKEL